MSLDSMKTRLDFISGPTREGRAAANKLKSFRSALRDPYQAETISFKDKKWRCLINPDKLKTDYDQKIISIDFEAGMQPGDTFYWDRTKSYWITYMQEQAEEAYYRASIRQCNYSIDVNGKQYWIYLRGPVETAIVWRQKNKIEMNDLNYSLMFYITANEETKEYFNRFRIIKFDGHNWRVATTDKYSQIGIIEVYLEEYYDNEMEDAMEVAVEVKPDIMHPFIEGPQFVKPYDKNLVYSIVGNTGGGFVVNSNKVKIVEQNEQSCVIEILTGRSSNFTLSYEGGSRDDSQDLEITIQSL